MAGTARYQARPAAVESPEPAFVQEMAPALRPVEIANPATLPTMVDLAEAMDAFVRAKGWYEADSKRPQTPRNLAASLAIEAGELLECFQWGDEPDRGDLEDELADVMLYALQLANVSGVDLAAVASRKLEKNKTRTWDDG